MHNTKHSKADRKTTMNQVPLENGRRRGTGIIKYKGIYFNDSLASIMARFSSALHSKCVLQTSFLFRFLSCFKVNMFLGK